MTKLPTHRRLSGQRPAASAPVVPAAVHTGVAGPRGRVLRVWQTAVLRKSGQRVEFMRFGGDHLRPLVWLQSLDYPMAPPWGLCVDAVEAGFGIISVRRPGFGQSSGVQNTDEEGRLLSEFLDQMGLEEAVLIVEGTSRRAGLKLALENPRIAFTVLARPGYASNGFGDLEPWMVNLILQALQSWAGARLSLAAIRQIAVRSGDAWPYQNFFKHPSDVAYIKSHRRDIAEAWGCLRGIEAETFQRELGALAPDESLKPGHLAGVPCMAVVGADTHADWRAGFEAKSAELGVRTETLPQGSFFALYQNPQALLQLIREAV